MKDVVDVLNQRIAELEAKNERLREGLGEALEWNWLDDDVPHYIREQLVKLLKSDAAMEGGVMSGLCKECGCDAEGLVSSLDEMDTELGKAQAEIERLREMNEHLINSDSVKCLQDAERYRWLRDAGVWITQASGLKCYRNTKADAAIDAAMEGE